MKNWNYINGAQVGNANITPVSKPNAPVKDPKKDDKEKDKDKKPSDPKDKEGYTFKERVKQVTGNSDGTEKLFHSLEKDVEKKEEDNDEKIEKVGNETYQHKLYPGKYVIIEGNNYKIITDGKVEKSGVLTDAVLYGINQTYKKVGNIASEYEILKQDPSKMHPAYKKAYEEALKKLSKEDEEMKKRFEREYGVKAKNEASDDKFAYVMREFDEGKLKTPDGKVVTDPAQAKAIAYSESKKTENGCARARNAMACNKKVRNSIYSELNKSDKRVVIEADGSWYVYDKNDKVIEQGRESNADNALGKFKAKGYNKKIGNRTPNYRYKGFLITNPEGYEYIVFLKDGVTVGYRGTTSKAQAEDWCDWHDPKTGKMIGNKVGNAMDPIKYKGYTIKFRPNSQKYYISSGPGDTYVREYAYKEYASEQDAKDAIDHLK